MVMCIVDIIEFIPTMNGRSNTLEKDTFQSNPFITSIYVLMRTFV